MFFEKSSDLEVNEKVIGPNLNPKVFCPTFGVHYKTRNQQIGEEMKLLLPALIFLQFFFFGLRAESQEKRDLLTVTRKALYEGIVQAREGNRLSDISWAIQSYVERHGFSVVRALVGHGIGKEMHEEPQVPNFGQPGSGPLLKVGMTLAIEPMVNAGHADVETQDDNWTVVTKDGSPSAHFEHTVAITRMGPFILTDSGKEVVGE